MITKVTKYER